MRNLSELDNFRVCTPAVIAYYGSTGDDTCGVFKVPAIDGNIMQIVASCDMGWEHVSVSMRDRCPTWEEMDGVKRMFFNPYETAIQFHVPEANHINLHPYCLHLWRPLGFNIVLPPPELVGPM